MGGGFVETPPLVLKDMRGYPVPIKTIRKGAGKKAKQRKVAAVMHDLKHSTTKRPRRQMIAIAMRAARIRRRKKR
jgi:hypothetical protein